MSLQYVSDNTGQHTAVLIPIEEWNEITAKHEDLKQLTLAEDKPHYKTERDLAEFGVILSKKVGKAMLKDIEKSREEWERDI